MKNILITLAFLGTWLLGEYPSNALLPQAYAKEPHAAITPYPGSVMSRRDDNGFGAYRLVINFDSNGKTDSELFETLNVEGAIIQMSFENPKERSHTEIFHNYRAALEEADYNILFSCSDAACGPSYIRSGWQRVTGMKYFTPKKHYLSASATHDGQKIYIAMVVGSRRHQIVIVEAGEMEIGLVDAKAITEGLLSDGRAVLEGLYFDTDKAILLEESKDALKVIAEFLNEQADLSVYIVGHTDGTGGHDHNMSLSKARAKSVVTALIEKHGIDKKRLKAEGVGPLSPAKTNNDAAGRAANRRVEMVAR